MKLTKKVTITLLALGIALSGLSLADAAGTWRNPTATPPNNNVDAPVNVGTDAQDKAGVLRVTGFRSFFDAIFDTKVQIGTTATMPTNLKLLVDGKVGAEAYCDRQGNNCVTSSGIPVSSNTNTSTSNTGSIGAPDYDSGWVDFGLAGNPTEYRYTHNLGTTNYIVRMEDKGDVGNGHNCPLGNNGVNSWLGESSAYLFYRKKEANTINILNYTNSTGQCARYVRLLLWKYSAGTVAPSSTYQKI